VAENDLETIPAPLGFIGVGRMGGAMLGRLRAAGHSVIIHDSDEAAVARLLSDGVTRADSPARVASRARIVFASLPTPPIVLEVVRGRNGVCRGPAMRIFVDLSTSGAPAAVAIDECLRERGVQSLDAPVSGGIAGARAGTLAIMASGVREAFDAVEPLLTLLGQTFYVGEKPGLGQTLKLANNLMSQAAIAITAEALAFGVKAGLDPQLMLDVINVSSGRNTASAVKFPKHVLTRGFDFGFSAGLALKDVRMCVEEAERIGVPMSVGRSVRELLAMTQDTYGGDSDCTCVARIVESRAGCEISLKRGTGS
jgi:3-hydroxyisobutyrate dehydrogenase-like beta-hydroxyacid dehydrogenase